ncbi:MAG: type II secretion system F family protein, partial [Patescibacteria group bacterium]|nr:type II secretion system F family protein [Patescibacteria group bacterium]
KEMLFTVNEMEKKNLRLYMAGISSVIEPILIMIVGILVGVVLLGVMMPMFNVGGMIADM